MKRCLFFRCNGGHYFQGAHCPFDGWTMDGIQTAVDRFAQLKQENSTADLESLRLIATSEDLMKRMMLVEFGDVEAAFDALAPDVYIHKGKQLRWTETGSDLR